MPSSTPSTKPSTIPSALPSSIPSAKPSAIPSAVPSAFPSSTPSAKPSESPSALPSSTPSSMPSAQPSESPSALPSSIPSTEPSASPSESPSALPSFTPSVKPSSTPSMKPSSIPSATPSSDPTSVGFKYKETFEGTKGVGSYGMWRDGRNNAQLHRGFADSGNWCIRLRKDTEINSSIYLNMTSADYDLLNVEFSYVAKNLKTGMGFVLEGTSNDQDLNGPWIKFEDWTFGVDLRNDVRYPASKHGVIISSYSPSLMIRIRAITVDTIEAVYIDDIEVVAIAF